MARRKHHGLTTFNALIIEGGLIVPAMLEKIGRREADQQKEADYAVPKGLALRDEIARYYRIGQALFSDFASLSAPSPQKTARFVESLLREVFGFTDIVIVGLRRVEERSYPVTLEALQGRAPVVVVPPTDGLDRVSDHLPGDGRRRSAASAIQDWLNANDDALWGFCANGHCLRLLRDNPSLTRPAYIEADLRQMFEADAFADFATLWLLIHASRFGAPGKPATDCVLERWRDAGTKAGLAARDRLRDGVEAALLALGGGFLSANPELREKLSGGALPLPEYFVELLRVIYRLIFLLVAEERNLLHPPETPLELQRLYAHGYSITSLREKAIRTAARDGHHDLWEGVMVLFHALAHGEPRLGLPALGGLFLPELTMTLNKARLPNRALIEAIFRLAWLRDDAALAPVNWRDMETEELGSVYESLLELTPRLSDDARVFLFAEGAETKGNARKTTGSYYTPDSLVQALLDSALDPVLDRVEREADDPAAALLSVKVIDPACGSGHFLLAAARRIAARVARARAGGVAGAQEFRHALRDVARQCIHGVDRNPMAVELTKVALWIETVEPGKPLGFLDLNIRCGDALLGVFDFDALRAGVPDEAYKPLAGDDKETAKYFARRNREEKTVKQGAFDFERGGGSLPAAPPLAQSAKALRALPEDSVEDIAEKERRLAAARHDAAYWNWQLAADLYVAAFLAPKRGNVPEDVNVVTVPTTGHVWRAARGEQIYPPLKALAVDLRREARVFHWPLEFPDVIGAGGFDIVLGNPPWERIKLQEQEFFASRDPEVASAPNAAARGRLIAKLKDAPTGSRDRALFDAFEQAKRTAEAASIFARVPGVDGGRFPLTGRGDVNTYALFAELFTKLAGARGRAGAIVPTGIATDATTAPFFGDLIQRRLLYSLYDFQTGLGFFDRIGHARFKFCLITIAVEGTGERDPSFSFFSRTREEFADRRRHFHLSAQTIETINPNTKTAPVFRTVTDAELTAKIYARIPVLVHEGNRVEGNLWGISFAAMLHMASDSGLFRTAAQLNAEDYRRDAGDWVEQARLRASRAVFELVGGTDALSLNLQGEATHHPMRYVPLYEAKMIHQFDHRWATYEPDGETSRDTTVEEKLDPAFEPEPRYWVPEAEVLDRLSPLPKEFKRALRERNSDLVAMLVAHYLFSQKLLEAGYPDQATAEHGIFSEWRSFVETHRALRGLAPTRLGLLGDNPALFRPTGDDCLPAAPIHEIVAGPHRSTVWYQINPSALEAVLAAARLRKWVSQPRRPLCDEDDLFNYGQEMLAQSCPKWLTGWRDICRSTDERTVIFSVMPRTGVGHTTPLMFTSKEPTYFPALLGNLNALVLDYLARQAVGGTHLTYGYLKQFPILPPSAYTPADLAFITPRVLELTYTSHSMAPFARDLGYDGPPFRWDEDGRALLRAELDAFYAQRYGLTRDELRYILDPADVKGPDYPSETFRVLKNNEMKRYGEYRTARLVLDAWDRFERGELE
jgi:hypothetical protein